jgi:hypothetical protein
MEMMMPNKSLEPHSRPALGFGAVPISSRRFFRLWLSSYPLGHMTRMFHFVPIPFTSRDQALTALSLGYAVMVLTVICASDPLASGVLYVGSVLLGTLTLLIMPIRFRCFYTLLFSAAIYLGVLIRGLIHMRDVGLAVDKDFFIVYGVFLVFLVLCPTVVAWIVTFFRKDKHVA